MDRHRIQGYVFVIGIVAMVTLALAGQILMAMGYPEIWEWISR